MNNLSGDESEHWRKHFREGLFSYAISARYRKLINRVPMLAIQLLDAGKEVESNAFIVKEQVVIGLN